MFVGVDDGLDDADAFTQQLGTQIRGRVDQQVTFRESQNRRAAGPIVLGRFAQADLTTAAQCRHADAGSRAQQDHFAAHPLSVWLLGGRHRVHDQGWVGGIENN